MLHSICGFFSSKLTAVHVDQFFASQRSPFFFFSFSISFFFFSLVSFALFLTSFRMTFYSISFPPGKLRETWIFECYQIWCLVRVSHYQGYTCTLPSVLYVSYALFGALKKKKKKQKNADRVSELSKSCANKRKMFAQTFAPIDAQFMRQNE